MTRGYVLLSLGRGRVEDVRAELQELEAVTRADIIAGAFDMIAEIEAGSEQGLLLLVTDKIDSLSGVGRTKTCIVRN